MKRTKNETRARILEAAVDLLEKKSSQSIQLRDIAERAGVSASLLVQYFGSKEELVFEARLVRLNAETQERFGKAFSPRASLSDVLTACFEHDLAFAAATKELMSLRWGWSNADETRFHEALGPRIAVSRAAVAREIEEKNAGAETVTQAYRLTVMVYLEVLREACAGDWTAEQAAARTKATLGPVLDAFRAPAKRAPA